MPYGVRLSVVSSDDNKGGHKHTADGDVRTRPKVNSADCDACAEHGREWRTDRADREF